MIFEIKAATYLRVFQPIKFADLYLEDCEIFQYVTDLDVRKVELKTMMGKIAEEMQYDEPDSQLKVKLGILANQIFKFGYIGAIVIAVLDR